MILPNVLEHGTPELMGNNQIVKEEFGVKNTLIDLNNHLFAQLERLSDEELKGEALSEEIDRAKSIAVIAKTIIDNGSLVLDAKKFRDNRMDIDNNLPKMLEG